jgi:hypothetical protein
MPHYNAVGCRCRSAHRAPARPGQPTVCLAGVASGSSSAVAGNEEKKKKILEQ